MEYLCLVGFMLIVMLIGAVLWLTPQSFIIFSVLDLGDEEEDDDD